MPTAPIDNIAATLVSRICNYLTERREEKVLLADLAGVFGMSPFHLQRTFKAVTGVTPRAYADLLRVDTLKARLRDGATVTTALYDAGYGSASRLYERAAGQLGMTPGVYATGGRGENVRYHVAHTAIGCVLVAATDKGICAVRFGDSMGALKAELRQEFPAARLEAAAGTLGSWVEGVLRHVDGRGPRPELPLDVRATAFQRLVWEHLRAIPQGSTRTYSEVARAIGRPKAVRAVARACATNPVAVVVPCHRVVRRDGDLAGYRWGIQRKRWLLEREGVAINKPAMATPGGTLPDREPRASRRRAASPAE